MLLLLLESRLSRMVLHFLIFENLVEVAIIAVAAIIAIDHARIANRLKKHEIFLHYRKDVRAGSPRSNGEFVGKSNS